MKKHAESNFLSAYIDGQLSAQEKAQLAAHLEGCQACRLELGSLEYTKKLLSLAPRRSVPPVLIADLEERLSDLSRPSLSGSWRSFKRSTLWIPTGVVVMAALVVSLWLGLRSDAKDRSIPLGPLLAAHSRYLAENLVPESSFASFNYSRQLNAYYEEEKDQETP